jgi:TolA-binding protein
MRLFWIIVGIVALVWLGFLHFDRNEIRLDLDKTNDRIDHVEHEVDNGQPVQNDNLNVGEEIQDEAQDAKEEIEQGIPSKEEQAKDEAQDEAEEAKEEKAEKGNQKEPQKEKPVNDVETSLPTEPTSFADDEAIVAFSLEYNDGVSHAFKQIETPQYNDELAFNEALLNIDPMILSLK